jgi:hypothetical protein
MPTSSTRSSLAQAAAKRKRPSRSAVVAKSTDAGTAKPRQKLVRDSFTIPKGEYAVLGELKERAARLIRPVKKGELLRAGIVALNAMPDRVFLATLSAVPSLKPGRPKSVDDELVPAAPNGARHRRKRP